MTVLNCLRKKSGRTLLRLQSQPVYKCEALRIFLRNESSFVPEKVLIMSKLSRYYFERLRESHLNEDTFRLKMLERGSDYEALLASHHANKKVESLVTQVLRNLNIEYRVADRTNVDQSSFSWADLILPIGGDGTFLLSANFVYDNKKPIMGINSHPAKSEGFLMLPAKYTEMIPEIFEMLRAGNYSILMRRRIRTILKGDGIWSQPFHMHEKGRVAGVTWFSQKTEPKPQPTKDLPKERHLPWLALNEVFMAESLSARTSSLLIKLDEEKELHRVKSSGLCVSTGTGSTSWHRAINSLSPLTVQNILKLVDSTKRFSKEEISQICNTFNDSLRFDPEDPRLCYAVRDMIIADSQNNAKVINPRGFCSKLTINSQCYDAGLVLDGGIAVPFNLGTTAVLQTFPEDSLKNIVLSS